MGLEAGYQTSVKMPETSRNKRPTLQIGDYFIYPEHSMLQSESGEVIEMECMAIEVLNYMASRSGEVVSIDELMEHVWTGKVVTQSTVRRIISLLRKALKDDVKSPTYIQNIPKRGYILVAEVTYFETTQQPTNINKANIATLSEVTTHSAPVQSTNKPSIRSKPVFMIASVIVAIVLLGYLTTQRDISWRTELDVIPVVSAKGAEKDLDYSSKVNKLIYSHKQTGEENWQLFSFDTRNKLSKQLTSGPDNNTRPQFSPDADKVAFLRKENGAFSIMVARFTPDNELSDIKPVYTSPLPIGSIIWDEYGDNLFFAATDERFMYSVFSINLEDGAVTRLTLPSINSGGDYLVSLSTDKKHLAVARLAGNETEIIGYRLEGFSPTFFRKVNAIVKSLAWHDGELLYLKGNTVFSIAQETDWEPRVFHEGKHLISQLQTADGKIFAIQGDLSNSEIRQYNNPFMPGTPIRDELTISSPQRDFSGIYSKTSDRIYFLSHRSGLRQIWQWDGESGYQQLTDLGSYQQIDNLQASPEDEVITGTIGRRLFMMDVDSKNLVYLSPENHYVSGPGWSVDGQSIYYINQYIGEHELWKVDINSQVAQRVDKNITSIQPMSDADQFIAHDSSSAFFYRVSTGERKPIGEDIHLTMNVSWQLVEDNLYWSKTTDKGAQLMRLNISNNQIESAPAPVTGFNHRFSVKQDQTSLLFNVSSSPQTDIVELQ